MQMNSENGFLKYENGKMLWPKQIYCQNNGHLSCILVKLPECAAWSKCARNSKKVLYFPAPYHLYTGLQACV